MSSHVELPACFTNVPFLPQERCERLAQRSLERLANHLGSPITLPVDVETLIEFVEELTVVYDGEEFFQTDDDTEALGLFDFKRQLVIVNEPLNEHVPRLRWTLAHEYGHYVLHAPLYKSGQQSLFEEPPEAVLLYRGPTSLGGKLEYQANMFAECLLMPREFMIEIARPFQERGRALAKVIANLPVGGIPPCDIWDQDLIQEVRRRCVVSRESARIRLQRLNLLAVS